MTVFTIGHSTRSTDELIALLRAAGIGYRHIATLGGLRRRPRGAPPSPNALWRSDAFRNYADYAMTEPFRDGLAELRGLSDSQVCAIMCAEAVWWRFLRRIVSDYLLAAGVKVEHIMGPGKIEPASLTPGAQPRPDGTIVYAGEVTGTLL